MEDENIPIEEEGSPLGGEELNSNLAGLEKNKLNELLKNKKVLIGIGAGIFVAIIIIIIIITVSSGSSGSSDNKDKKEDDIVPPPEEDEIYGELECIYDIETSKSETQILGNDFVKGSDITIKAAGKYINYSKNYKFPKTGEQTVIFYFVNSKEISLDNMFKGVIQIKSIKFIKRKEIKIKSMKSLFENCVFLENVDIQDFDISEATSLSRLFFNCKSLTSFDLSIFNLEKVTDMSYLFAGSSINEFSPNEFNIKSVEDMSHFFDGCSSLTSVRFPEMQSRNLRDISYMFANCESLNYLDLSTFDMSYVGNMQGLFK